MTPTAIPSHPARATSDAGSGARPPSARPDAAGHSLGASRARHDATSGGAGANHARGSSGHLNWISPHNK